ncbi:MAG: TasA family protein [Candidatus Limivicinus sp.]|nr:TasA family protein [Candidatus Limivicinus sp.]
MKKKITAIALVVCLVAVAVVGGSLAYFTDTDKATNTFTVGNVDITLTEPKWVEEKATLIPGREIAKDPTITVEETSQRAYTFMKVQLSDDFAQLIADYATAQKINPNDETQMKALIAAWFSSTVQPKIMEYSLTENYVILGVLSPKDPGQSVTYFDAITVPAEVVGSMIKADGTYEIYITAYAIQAEGFEGQNADAFADRQAAFDALFA